MLVQILLFCYVFAFYVGGISISILMMFPLFVYAIFNTDYLKCIYYVSLTKYIRNVLAFYLLIVFLSLFYPVLYGTYDMSFFRIIAAQLIHIIAAIPFFAYLLFKKITYKELERDFIKIFIWQTLIQLVVVNSKVLGDVILYFNHFDPTIVVGIGSNIRGKALSAATTYHLSMAYGICFIIYVKHYLNKAISFLDIFVGVLLFIGIFFAGRSGFVGCAVAFLGYQFYIRNSMLDKIVPVFKVLINVLIICVFCGVLLYYFIPDFYKMVVKQILPYAFEFLYSMDKSGGIEMASTNRLGEMWTESDFNYWDFIIGSGKYSNADGSYYMHVDPGILRHTLFMGVFGYIVLMLYQLCLLPVYRMIGKDRYYYYLVLIFLFVMELKAVNIGVNKFAFAICLLFSFSYFYLKPAEE